jgi:hypothetical protein
LRSTRQGLYNLQFIEEESMERLTSFVEGSKGKQHRVTFTKNGAEMRAYCRCAGGVKGGICDHRIALLNGDGSKLVSGYETSLETVRAWLPGTELEVVLHWCNEAKRAFERSKTEELRRVLKAARDDLARVMFGKGQKRESPPAPSHTSEPAIPD